MLDDLTPDFQVSGIFSGIHIFLHKQLFTGAQDQDYAGLKSEVK